MQADQNDIDQGEAAIAFAAIGSDARLQVLRSLVRAGEGGLTVGDIQEKTGIAPSTLSHHIRTLVDAGIVLQRKAGRATLSVANFDRLRALSTFILIECCADSEPDHTLPQKETSK